MGIEPTHPAWKAGVLPLNYTRIKYSHKSLVISQQFLKLLTLDSWLLTASTGGEGRIRTSVGRASRFTVCPLWPLGYLSLNYSQKSPVWSQKFSLLTIDSWLFTASGAGDGIRTRNLLITNQLLCRWATPAKYSAVFKFGFFLEQVRTGKDNL